MKSEKKFDAVKMMREIRDTLSKEMSHMSYEEQKKFITKGLKTKQEKHKFKRDALVA